MRHAPVTPNGDLIRWVELPGAEPARLYLHGLGASSPVYFAAAAAHPLLAGRRSLLLDLLGFGISDRPTDFGYTLEEHADAVAAAVRAAGLSRVEVVGHSMGGAVAIVLAHRHPALVSRLLLVDANLDRIDPARQRPGSSGIASYTEAEFLAGGRDEVAERVGPFWWSTMRLADPRALHRSARHLARATEPTMREMLLGLDLPRTFLYPAADGDPTDGDPTDGDPTDGGPADADGLRAAGVRVVAVPDCGHNIMLDNPDGFAAAAADALGLG
ncbi:alpha/beta fold hydrolase [Streptomyces sp. 1331.2]|uniref:alpha/beta fold hydrolase n=1 Tax=Streptomyces sp. 1331.2 TaxID=1938835 RepID=UPI000BC83F55|nr:alpha/beta hydrolase [Streptomyces sp. 1331.2]SOB80185.1 Pimeloyl-ACP methyl ester carboxylesterase [Streptomyces sp. 1331.2]